VGNPSLGYSITPVQSKGLDSQSAASDFPTWGVRAWYEFQKF
jgi:hypothetical protein